ncbi:MAG: MFS transporter [Chloroflexi bacterium]|nr:MFS transporter [Chloroflexota bacterium]
MPRLFFGWWILSAAVSINALIAIVYTFGFNAFFVPWREAFGWSRAQLGGVVGLSRLQGGLVAPLAGWLVDKYGPRTMMLLGLGLLGLGFIALSRVNSFFMLLAIFLALLSTGSSLGVNRPIQVTVANWFIRLRGRAMGLLAAGMAGGGSLVFLFAMVIDKFGWRVGAIVAGLLIWGIGLPLALVFRHRPEDMGLLPDGRRPDSGRASIGMNAEAEPPPSNSSLQLHPPAERRPVMPLGISKILRIMARDRRPELDVTAWQAVRTPAFWLMAAGWAMWATASSVHMVHWAPFLVEELKMDYVAALSALSFFSIVSLFARLGFGFAADYISIRFLATLVIATEGLGILLLSQARDVRQLLAFTVVFAIGHGGSLVLWPVLQGHFFGRRAFGTIGGIVQFIQLPMGIGAPIWVGYLADTVPHGYRWGFGLVGILILGAALCVSMPRRPFSPLPTDRPPALFNALRAHWPFNRNTPR